MSQLASQCHIATPTSNPLPSCTAILVSHIAQTSHCCCWSKHLVTSCKSKDKTSIKSWHLIHHIRTIQHGVGEKLVLLIWYRVINISVTKMRRSPLSLADQMKNRIIWTLSYWWFIESFYSQSLSHKTVFTHFQMLWMSQRYEYKGTKKPRLSLSAPFFYFSQFYLSKEKEIYSDFYDLCLLTHLKVGEFTLHLSKLLIKEKWEGSKQTWRGHVKI